MIIALNWRPDISEVYVIMFVVKEIKLESEMRLQTRGSKHS